MAILKVLVCVMAAILIAEAAITPLALRSLVQPGKLAKDGDNCVCMNWRNCDGEINSDVECHPSYINVCCIRPKPEPILPSVFRI